MTTQTSVDYSVTSLSTRKQASVLELAEVGIDDLSLVGCKNASLGELTKNLRVPGRLGQRYALSDSEILTLAKWPA